MKRRTFISLLSNRLVIVVRRKDRRFAASRLAQRSHRLHLGACRHPSAHWSPAEKQRSKPKPKYGFIGGKKRFQLCFVRNFPLGRSETARHSPKREPRPRVPLSSQATASPSMMQEREPRKCQTENRYIARWFVNYRFVRSGAPRVGTVPVGTRCSLNYSQHECETQIDPRDRLCQLVFVQQMENGPKHVQRNKDQ